MELWVVDAGGWAAGWDVEMVAVVADAEGVVVLVPEKAAAVALVLSEGCDVSFSVLDSSITTAGCISRRCLCMLFVEPAR